ncbi:CRP/FNR family transcriptional regulator, anaerobic regulatory protein [Thalassobacillus cyri]|uniref:CRP/FNR family transcriptional regulator, anaerobic regulatory protein n=1 Tax=Thalassobacillus cyri TaxID=571932 RepID=A0A1H3VIX1_9BACI|nr:Crp/Fnr family transcriptional regulator [Thalassobacillus cyri]SDZ74720.1 CRP/FNR family transcriptional regulator, anaerobic regulatory protein [Thalassobacillus cyri]
MVKQLSKHSISENLKELLSSVDHVQKIEKNRFLFQEGEDADQMFIIQSGRIQISKISPDGRELSLRICQKGDIIGELTLFTDDATYLLNAKVMEDAEVAVIKKDYLERELLTNTELAFEFMKWMSEHFRKTQTKFRDLVLHGKKGALYSTLIRLTNSYGVKRPDDILIDIVLTNQELANFCGTSRESVNRMLSDLKRKEVLEMEKNKIVVKDLQYLKDEINCENCPIVLCSID